MALHLWLFLCVVVVLTIRFLSFRYIYGLQRFKGPLLASFTDAWRFSYHFRRQGIPYRDLHDRFGDIVRVGPNVLSFRDPRAIREIFGAGVNWGKSGFYTISESINNGRSTPTLFSSTDMTWHKNVRKAVNQFFTQTAVLTYEPFVERTIGLFVNEMDNRFAGKQGAAGIIDLHTWLSFFAFDVMSDLTYSKHHGFISHGEDMHSIIHWVGNFLEYGWVVGQMPWVSKILRHNPILLWLERRKLYAGNTFPGATFAIGRIQAREQQKPTGDGGDRREDLLDKFRRARRERPEHITNREVVGLSLSTMFAGAETSAISMLAVFYYVLRTPGCYSKLQQELDTHLRPKSPATNSTYFEAPFSQTRELPYLHACIQEAFRMCPALGSMLERVVPPSGAKICGVSIPGGTIVGCNAWVVQRHKQTFGEDCDTYRPERWLGDAEKTRKMERAMFQFGAGAHICLGQHIALMEIYKLVPSILRTYEVSLINPEEEWTVVPAVNVKQIGVYVRMKRRSDF